MHTDLVSRNPMPQPPSGVPPSSHIGPSTLGAPANIISAPLNSAAPFHSMPPPPPPQFPVQMPAFVAQVGFPPQPPMFGNPSSVSMMMHNPSIPMMGGMLQSGSIFQPPVPPMPPIFHNENVSLAEGLPKSDAGNIIDFNFNLNISV